MKSVSGALATHLGQETTTLASCWHITRRDGIEFFFTDHDTELEIDGDTYIASLGYTRTAVDNDSSMAVDNLDVMGFIDNSLITLGDLRAGLFDYAEIRIFMVNWADLSQGILKLRRGRIGEVIAGENGVFKTELRGMTQALSQQVGQVYSAECRVDLGDSKCRVAIQPDLAVRDTAYSVGDFVRVITDGAANGQARFENRIYECTTAGKTYITAPTFDTAVGNTTTEADSFAINTLRMIGPGNVGNGQSITVGTLANDTYKSWTFQNTLTNVDGNVKIGATYLDTCANLLAALTLGAGAGTLYAAATTAHPEVGFAAGPNPGEIVLTALTAGSAYNTINLVETMNNTTFDGPYDDSGHAHLSGGAPGVIWTAREAWTRHAVVASVVDSVTISLTITEPRDVDDWFNGGVLTFESGDNEGFSIEIKDWVQTGTLLTMFLPPPYPVVIGDEVRLYRGCDKKIATCINVFNNVLNFRGEPYVPGMDALVKIPDAK